MDGMAEEFVVEEAACLREQVAAAEATLIEREAELADLRAGLLAFRLQYDARVGRQVAELEAIEAQIARCRERMAQYREWGPMGPPHVRPGAIDVPVEEQYRRTWQERQERPELPSPPPDVPLDAASEARIKKLYRQLCRRFHPDLAQDPEERVWRTEVMAAVNAAYAACDLAGLQKLAVQFDVPIRSLANSLLSSLLNSLLEQIQHRLGEVEREIQELANSETVQMSLDVKLARRQGRDLLAEMAAEVEQDLARKRAELDWMVAQLRGLGIVCE
jgi:hypothetical protein